MKMRKSRVLAKMREGKVATCTKINLSCQRAVEIAATCGFDCVWVDMEHVPSGIETVERAVLAAKAHDCDILTRVRRGSYSDLITPLEADSTGIMVPHLMNFEQAKEIVYYTKFHPIGRRPIDGGNADGAYCMIDANEYMHDANNERFNVVQIEDPEPLEDLEEICALPGIDMIFFGPADFSQGIGCPNDFSNPAVLDTKKRVAECARRHGKFAGTVGSANNFDELVDMGYTFINTGSDVRALAIYFGDILKTVSDKKIKEI